MHWRVAARTLIVLAAGTSCGGAKAISGDAGTEGGAHPGHFCDGLPALPDQGVALEPPFVTFQEDTGQGCVLRLGSPMAERQVCGDAGPSALIEPGCPSTSLLFDVWGSAFFTPKFYVQGGYASTSTAGDPGRNGRVLEMAIDSTTGNIATGHFQVELQARNSAPAARASGTFALCATTGSSIEPCRGL